MHQPLNLYVSCSELHAKACLHQFTADANTRANRSQSWHRTAAGNVSKRNIVGAQRALSCTRLIELLVGFGSCGASSLSASSAAFVDPVPASWASF
jgi:hypothetical protein